MDAVKRDHTVGLAAEVAFYGVFSLFPFVILLRSVEPYLPEGHRLIPGILSMLKEVTADGDGQLSRIIQEQILEPASGRHLGVLSLASLTLLWGASRAFGVVVKAVSRANDREDKRSWVERRLIGLGITVVLLLLLVAGFLIGIFGPHLLTPLAPAVGLHFVPDVVWRLLRWPLAGLLLGAALSVLYYVAPTRRARLRWTAAGSASALVMMLVLSYLLSLLLTQDFFRVDWLTYSAFGLVLVVLLWMYLAALAVLLGAQIDALLERKEDQGELRESSRARPQESGLRRAKAG